MPLRWCDTVDRSPLETTPQFVLFIYTPDMRPNHATCRAGLRGPFDTTYPRLPTCNRILVRSMGRGRITYKTGNANGRIYCFDAPCNSAAAKGCFRKMTPTGFKRAIHQMKGYILLFHTV